MDLSPVLLTATTLKPSPAKRALGFGLALSLSLVLALAGQESPAQSGAQTPAGAPRIAAAAAALPSAQEVQNARAAVRTAPHDPKAHMNLAELLRKLGRQREAAQEYLEVTDLDPYNYLAYHQLSTLNADPSQLDEAIVRLSKLKDEKPKELMLRVALSELYERRGSYYQGARVLVDLVYQNGVPAKYHARVNARIHFLLTKQKDSQTADKSFVSEEELDSLPPPLPEASIHKDLAASKLKESRVMRGLGNTPLLP